MRSLLCWRDSSNLLLDPSFFFSVSRCYSVNSGSIHDFSLLTSSNRKNVVLGYSAELKTGSADIYVGVKLDGVTDRYWYA